MATIANRTMQQNELQEKNKELAKPTFGAQQSATSSAPSAPQNNAQAPASSGGFTNIQKFVDANQKAGANIGNRIQTGISSDLGAKVTDATKKVGGLEGAVGTAQTNVAAGQQFYRDIGGGSQLATKLATPTMEKVNMAQESGLGNVQQNGQPMQKLVDVQRQYQVNPLLDSILKNTQNIASDQNKLTQFSGLRTGTTQEADRKNLTNTAAASQAAADKTSSAIKGRLAQLQDQNSQADLISEFVKNPRYTQGAKNLDAVLFGRNQAGVKNIQDSIKQKRDVDYQNILNRIQATQPLAKTAMEQGSDVTRDLSKQVASNESGYLDTITNKIDEVNRRRATETDRYKQEYKNLAADKGVTQQFADMLGLTSDSRVYNTFKDRAELGNLEGVTLNEAKASNYRDVADAENVAQYNYLSKLAGIDPTKLDKAGNLGNIISVDKDKITGALKGSEEYFNEQAKKDRGYSYNNINGGEYLMYGGNLENYLKNRNAPQDIYTATGYEGQGQNLSALLSQGILESVRPNVAPINEFLPYAQREAAMTQAAINAPLMEQERQRRLKEMGYDPSNFAKLLEIARNSSGTGSSAYLNRLAQGYDSNRKELENTVKNLGYDKRVRIAKDEENPFLMEQMPEVK